MTEASKTSLPTSQAPSHAMTLKEDLGGRSMMQSGSTASEMVASQTEAEVKAGFALSQLNPRNEEDSRIGILRACTNPKFAEKAIYKKPIGNQRLEGPSIRFAEEMLRNWRNVKVIQMVIFDSPRARIVRVITYDLQANIPYSQDIIIEKTVERKSASGREVISERLNSYNEKVSIVVATEDEVQIKQSAQVSKAIRNNGLRLIPAHIIDEAMERCRETLRAGVKDPQAEIRNMFNSFAKLGINPSDIEAYLKKPTAQIIAQDIVELKSVYNAIKDGETTWAAIMASTEEVKPEGSGPATETITPETEKQIKENWDAGVKPGDPSTHTHPGAAQTAPATK